MPRIAFLLAGLALVACSPPSPAPPTPAPAAVAAPPTTAPTVPASPRPTETARPTETPRPATATPGPAASPSPGASPAARAPGFAPLAPSTVGPTASPACPGAVAWNQAKSRAGQQATVSGPVARTNYAMGSRGQPTFVDLGVGFPDPNRFTVVIWGEHRGAFPSPPEQLYRGRTVCVTGTVQVREEIAQIEVTAPSAIRIVP